MLVNQFLILAAVLFCIGVYGVIARKNAVLVLMSIELILNSVNINLLAFSMRNGSLDGHTSLCTSSQSLPPRLASVLQWFSLCIAIVVLLTSMNSQR